MLRQRRNARQDRASFNYGAPEWRVLVSNICTDWEIWCVCVYVKIYKDILRAYLSVYIYSFIHLFIYLFIHLFILFHFQLIIYVDVSSMYVCVYIYIYVCVCVWLYNHDYIYMCVCYCVCIYICIYDRSNQEALTVPVAWDSLSPRITQHFTHSVDRSVSEAVLITCTWTRLDVAW